MHNHNKACHASWVSYMQVCTSHKEISLVFDTIKDLADSPADYDPQKSYLERIGPKKEQIQNFFKAKPSTKTSTNPASLNLQQISPRIDTKVSEQRQSASGSESQINTDGTKLDTQLVDQEQTQARTNLSGVPGSTSLPHQSYDRSSHCSDITEIKPLIISKTETIEASKNCSQPKIGVRKAEEHIEPPFQKVARNAFTTMLTASKRMAISKKTNDSGSPSRENDESTTKSRASFAKGLHANVLRQVALNPERYFLCLKD